MKILFEQNVILEVDVPTDQDQLEFELDDEGNNIAGKKNKEEPEEKPEEESEEKAQEKSEEKEDNQEEEPDTEEEPEDDDAELPDEPEEDSDIEDDEENPDSDSNMDDSGDDSELNNQNELITKERELFSDLSDKQLSIRDKELRGNYLRVYNTCNDIIENMKLIPKSSNNISALSFVNTKMEELKDFISDYISNTYHTKTYLENQENYQYYIVILNKINKLFKELVPKKQLSGKYTK